MLKTISAALLAVSVLAAPAFAADAGKTAPGAGYQGRAGEDQCAERQRQNGPPSSQAFPPSSLHRRMARSRRSSFSKVTIKHVMPASKRG